MTTACLAPTDAWHRIANNYDSTITFVDDDTEVFTFHDLMARAAAHLPALREFGVRRGEPVLITAHVSAEFLCCCLGLMLHGAVPVPVPPREALRASGQFLGRVQPLLDHHRGMICQADERDEIRTVRTDFPTATFDWFAENLDLDYGRSVADRLASAGIAGWPLCAMDDDAYVQYTSGSTAAPRGIVISYRNLLSNMAASGRGLGIRPGDVMASWLPLHHDMGLVCSLFVALFNGISTVHTTPHRFLHDPLGFLRLLTSTGATHSLIPNFAAEWLINARNRPGADLHGIDLRAFRSLTVAAEPVSPETMRRFVAAFTDLGLRPTTACSGYGLAESTCAVTLSAPDTGFKTQVHQGVEVVTGGRVLDGYEIRIDAPPGEQAGAIMVRGDSVSANAYIDGKKVKVLDEDGFCDTKDIGYLVGDELVILGRQDEMFIMHGANKFPYDIESIVRAESGQERLKVACFGAADRVIVVLEPRQGAPIEPAVAEELRRRISATTGLAVDELITVPRGTIPVTTSGKIKRKVVAEAYRSGALPRLATQTWGA
ncbi:AMP-binding protein [Nocardia colli]|uniref:AMP-binding protein n=1 Tax=Nocardia colli TaxID=2545717 RepID=UPI0035E20A7F